MKVRGFESIFTNTYPGTPPVKATGGSAGYDLYLPEDVLLPSKHSSFIWLNVRAYMPKDEVLMIYIRSSLAIKKGIVLTNGTGIIDSDYYDNPTNAGNIGLSLTNTSDRLVYLVAGTRVAQGIFMKYLLADDDYCVDWSYERVGGIGSTD